MRPALVVVFVLLVPALAFWTWFMVQRTRVALLCPEGCWCDPGGINVDCTDASLEEIPQRLPGYLQQFTIDDNNFTTLKKNVFFNKELSQLRRLSMGSCKLVNLEIGAFNGLDELIQLSLMDNALSELKPRVFENLSKLLRLYLGWNEIENLKPDAFSNLIQLEDLYLNNNKIVYLQPDILRHLPKLNLLILGENKDIIISSDKQFINAPTLKKLYLSGCNIRTISKNTFKNCTDLTLLDLSENNLTHFDLDILENLPRIRRLFLFENPLTCDCRLKSVWEWCSEHNIRAEKRQRVPRCYSPENVSELWWGVLKHSECFNGNISFHSDYRSISEDYEEEDHKLQFKETMNFIKYGQASIYLILFIFGATGNTILILIFSCNQHMRTVANMYIFNLAISDLISIIINLPVTHWRMASGPRSLGNLLCKGYTFARCLAIGLSGYSVALLSIQRYQVTVRPFQSRHSSSKKKVALVTILSVWILVSLFALPPTFSIRDDMYCSQHDSAIHYRKVVIFELLVFCISPLCVIVIMYVMTARHLVKSNLPVFQNMEHPQHVARRNIAKIVLALSIVFVISYVPYHIIIAYETWFEDYGRGLWYMYFSSTCLLVFNSCFNPIALLISSSAYRKLFKRYLLCCCRRKKSVSLPLIGMNESEVKSRTQESDL